MERTFLRDNQLATIGFGKILQDSYDVEDMYPEKAPLLAFFQWPVVKSPSLCWAQINQAWADRPHLQSFIILVTVLSNRSSTWKFTHFYLNLLLFKAS